MNDYDELYKANIDFLDTLPIVKWWEEFYNDKEFWAVPLYDFIDFIDNKVHEENIKIPEELEDEVFYVVNSDDFFWWLIHKFDVDQFEQIMIHRIK